MSACHNCEVARADRGPRCHPCYRYWLRHDRQQERPLELIWRHFELEPWRRYRKAHPALGKS